MLEIQRLSKTFAGKPPLFSDFSLRCATGSITAVLGASGCGKSTLLRVIAGLENGDSGEIILNGTPIHTVPPQLRNVGFVFQQYALFPHLNVLSNITFGLYKLPKKQARQRAMTMLATCQIAHLATSHVCNISGGEQQRVAIARTLVTRPKVLLLDEPFASLDQTLRHDLRQWCYRFIQQQQITTLLVTHDPQDTAAVNNVVTLGRSD